MVLLRTVGVGGLLIVLAKFTSTLAYQCHYPLPTQEPTSEAPWEECPTQEPITDAPHYEVELRGGNHYYEGNVYAKNRCGEFGPVCDDGWDCHQANVVCQQLGFEYAKEYHTRSAFGSVPNYFAMDDVRCYGWENSLQQCGYIMSWWENCDYGEGAGVTCWYHEWEPTDGPPTDWPWPTDGPRPTDGPTDWPTENPTDRPTDSPSTSCPHGWLDADYLGCYKPMWNEGGIMWPMAQQVCEDMGGYLAEPDTDEKFQLLTSLIEMAFEDEVTEDANYWIGLTDQGHEGAWEWAHSGDFMDYYDEVQWGSGRPHYDNNNHNDCVIFRHVDDCRWADVDCFGTHVDGLKNAIICQWNEGNNNHTIIQ